MIKQKEFGAEHLIHFGLPVINTKIQKLVYTHLEY